MPFGLTVLPCCVPGLGQQNDACMKTLFNVFTRNLMQVLGPMFFSLDNGTLNDEKTFLITVFLRAYRLCWKVDN